MKNMQFEIYLCQIWSFFGEKLWYHMHFIVLSINTFYFHKISKKRVKYAEYFDETFLNFFLGQNASIFLTA